MDKAELKHTVGVVGHWGMWDVRDACWIGCETGPITYESQRVARCAGVVFSERFDRQIVPKLFRNAHKDELVKKDEVTPAIGCDEAIARLAERHKI